MTNDIITVLQNKGHKPTHIESQQVPNTGNTSKASPSVRIISCENGKSFYIKNGHPWRVAGEYTGEFSGWDIAVNNFMFENYILPQKMDLLFQLRQNDEIYHCSFEKFKDKSVQATQPDGEQVRVLSFREFQRWT